ncbi:MAG TPA: cation diffusion facilitator family transporter [Anaeromyxobacter sp.]|nr:cation diffusion facilitator family transporter [Anaeromyxobacter sp.]
MQDRPALARFAALSIAAAVATIGLKVAAWRLTGSVGLLSDALESGVNLAAAVMTLAMLAVAARPPNEAHAFGYGKAEYVSSGAEGALIIVAAAGIAWAAVGRLIHPQPVERVGFGLALSVGASLVNLSVGRVLISAGRRHHSIALEADGRHLMTDVWTSAGVVLGIGAVAATGWVRLDPIIAIAVAVQIVWSGVRLIRRSWLGLLDRAIPESELAALRGVLERYSAAEGIRFHAVWTRQSGARRFVSMHVLVPGAWSVSRGHALLERIEEDVSAALPNAHVFTHLEAVEDPSSFADQHLDRVLPGPAPRP